MKSSDLEELRDELLCELSKMELELGRIPRVRSADLSGLDRRLRSGGLSGGRILGIYYEQRNVVIVSETLKTTRTTKRVLMHELGHAHNSHYLRTRQRRLAAMLRNNPVSGILIDEGICEYLSAEITGRPVANESVMRMWIERGFDNEIFKNLSKKLYSMAYAYVLPVIDEFGGRGIRFMLDNLPRMREVDDPRKYWERAGRTLR